MVHDEEQRTSGPASIVEGVLYSASGESYVAQAIRSACSSLRHNPLPHLVLASTDVVSERVEGLTIERFQSSGNAYADKIANMRRSPFERTLYLDCDTYVIEEIAHVLRLLDRYDVAIAPAPGYRGLADPEVPMAFYEFNTGVIAWRSNERMAAFMRSWQETYAAWIRKEPFPGAHAGSMAVVKRRPDGGAWLPDQPPFRRCAWQHGVRVFVLTPEYNLRIPYPAAVVGKVRVLHGTHADFEALATSINRRQGVRAWSPPRSLVRRISRRLRGIAGRVRNAVGVRVGGKASIASLDRDPAGTRDA